MSEPFVRPDVRAFLNALRLQPRPKMTAFNIAAMRGHGDAARLRREIAEQMSDGEIGSAQRTARDWLRTRVQPAAPIRETRIAA